MPSVAKIETTVLSLDSVRIWSDRGIPTSCMESLLRGLLQVLSIHILRDEGQGASPVQRKQH